MAALSILSAVKSHWREWSSPTPVKTLQTGKPHPLQFSAQQKFPPVSLVSSLLQCLSKVIFLKNIFSLTFMIIICEPVSLLSEGR